MPLLEQLIDMVITISLLPLPIADYLITEDMFLSYESKQLKKK